MRPQYITIVGGTPKVVPLDNNMVGINVSVRTDATTVEVTLEDPAGTPTWVAAPAAGSNGVIVIKDPVRALRFSKATNGSATVLQQGIR